MDEEKRERFIKLLKQELQNRNIGIMKFASMIGVTRMTVYRWFNGKASMSLDVYYKILEVLGWEDKAI